MVTIGIWSLQLLVLLIYYLSPNDGNGLKLAESGSESL